MITPFEVGQPVKIAEKYGNFREPVSIVKVELRKQSDYSFHKRYFYQVQTPSGKYWIPHSGVRKVDYAKN